MSNPVFKTTGGPGATPTPNPAPAPQRKIGGYVIELKPGEVVFREGDLGTEMYIIQEGKIEGNKFSFNTVTPTPNGDVKTAYSGTVEGNMLKGTAEREGGQARPFEAKRK